MTRSPRQTRAEKQTAPLTMPMMVTSTLRSVVLLAAMLSLGCGSTTEEELVAGDTDIVINELLSKSSGTVNADWVELFNVGDADVDIGYWTLGDSRDRDPFAIPGGTILQAGQYYVIAYDESGELGFSFGLGDDDAVRLFDAAGALVDSAEWSTGSVREDESWGRYPNGSGDFAKLITATQGGENVDTCGNGTLDPAEDCDGDDFGTQDCTTFSFVSGALGCSDCRVDTSSCVTVQTEVVINEVIAKATDGTVELPDWVELRNNGASEVDLSGWTLSDEKSSNVYAFAEGSTIAGGAYLVLDSTALGFGFGAEDAATLRDRASVIVDETSWVAGAAPEGTSWGRLSDGLGEFQTLHTPTPDAENQP